MMDKTSSATPSTDNLLTQQNVEIDAPDVIRLILQFLKENQLLDTLQQLQKESGLVLNTVDNVASFANDIKNGRWDLVLSQVATLKLPADKLTALYEQVLLELLEAGERDLAREVLRTADPLVRLKLEHPEKFLKLETFCKRPYFSATDAYEMGHTKETQRKELVESLVCEVSSVEPSRLLSLLSQAMRYQQTQGILPPGKTFDLFKNTKKTYKKDIEDKIVKFEHTILQAVSFPTSAPFMLFSPAGDNFILGNNRSSAATSEGTTPGGEIEVWDSDICQLRKDLEYQAQGKYLSQESPVLCGTYSKDGDYIAIGSLNGAIRIFRISSGQCLKTLIAAHRQGITSLMFSKDGTQLLSASFDQTARIHGLKSGKSLREFRGHTSFVNVAVYLKDQSNNIMTASSDGTVKIWDSKTTECLLTIRPGLLPGVTSFSETPITTLLPVPNHPDQLLACMKSSQANIINTLGQTVRTFNSGKLTGGDFVAAAFSPQGKWLYCAGEDRQVYVFDVSTGELEDMINITISHDILQLVHHPARNLLAIVTTQGKIQILSPP